MCPQSREKPVCEADKKKRENEARPRVDDVRCSFAAVPIQDRGAQDNDKSQKHEQCAADSEVVHAGHVGKARQKAGKHETVGNEGQNRAGRHADAGADVFRVRDCMAKPMSSGRAPSNREVKAHRPWSPP